jgi:hypothetical protein
MSASDILQFLSSVATPLSELRATLRRYKENKKIQKELADALETEADEYNAVMGELSLAGDVAINIVKEIKKQQPTPTQVLDFMDVVSQMPRILAKLLVSYIHLAKACREISNQKGFMESLRTSNNYVHDFIEIMSNAYIAKNTIKIDGNFFRFYRVYKSEIVKHEKSSKLSKSDSEALSSNIDSLLEKTKNELKKHHTRRPLIKHWKSSFDALFEVSKDVKVEDVDYEVLKDVVPLELQEFIPLLDKSQ